MGSLHQPMLWCGQRAIIKCVGFVPSIPPGSVGHTFGAQVRDGEDNASMCKPMKHSERPVDMFEVRKIAS